MTEYLGSNLLLMLTTQSSDYIIYGICSVQEKGDIAVISISNLSWLFTWREVLIQADIFPWFISVQQQTLLVTSWYTTWKSCLQPLICTTEMLQQNRRAKSAPDLSFPLEMSSPLTRKSLPSNTFMFKCCMFYLLFCSQRFPCCEQWTAKQIRPTAEEIKQNSS